MPLAERTLELAIGGLLSKDKSKLAIGCRTPREILVFVDCLIESKGLILGKQLWGKTSSCITFCQFDLAAFLRAAEREMTCLYLSLKVDRHTLCVEQVFTQLER